MDPSHRSLIESLYRTPCQCVLAVTGGGATAIGSLLSVPGASRCILEAVVPYHERALMEFLGRRPSQFCSVDTSEAIAVRARERAGWLAPGARCVGLGCTAGLASDRPKKGEHRFHVATATGDRVATHSLVLHKGSRDRAGEEAVLHAVLLNALAEAAGIAERVAVSVLPGEAMQTESRLTGDLLTALLEGSAQPITVEKGGRLTTSAPRPRGLLPGAFNPVHEGHWKLAAVAAELLGGEVAFELSVRNVDKPPLSAPEARRRAGQFTWKADLWLTRAPTFLEKAEVFPGITFVVGADTASRIVQARYYGNSESQMKEALQRIRFLGCRFLVAGREDGEGRWVGCESLDLPADCRDLFTGIPAAWFRVAVSSTDLRRRAAEAGHAASAAEEA